MKIPRKTSRDPDGFALDGQLLIAMPGMRDRRFAGSVIYLCAHSCDGAMGLIINKRADHISFPDLLGQLDLDLDVDPDLDLDAAEDGLGEDDSAADFLDMAVHVGGPVESGRGFVLHSADYFTEDSTLSVADDICLTATIDILKAIAAGDGPDRVLMALGYAGWAPGQLENEIGANGWLHCPADPDLVFDRDLKLKYQRALFKIGIDPSHLVSDAGHA